MPFGLSEEQAKSGPRGSFQPHEGQRPEAPTSSQTGRPEPGSTCRPGALLALRPPHRCGMESRGRPGAGAVGPSPGTPVSRTSPLTGGLSDRRDLPTKNILSEKVIFCFCSHGQRGSAVVCLGPAGSNTGAGSGLVVSGESKLPLQSRRPLVHVSLLILGIVIWDHLCPVPDRALGGQGDVRGLQERARD